MRTLVALLSLLLTVYTEGNTNGHWSYPEKGTGNGDVWSEHFPNCAGQKQSPINIQTNKVVESKFLEPLELSGYGAHRGEFQLINNGHTVQITLPSTMHITRGMSNVYTAVQGHFHWGRKTTGFHGSEHTLNGVPFDCEMHLVHFNSEKYSSFEEAQDKPDGLAVVAIFIEGNGKEKNVHYEKFISHLSEIPNPGDNITLDFIDIQHMLPHDFSTYFRYDGSLTTPPCTENVSWTILAKHVTISTQQLQKIEHSLKNNNHQTLQNNFREVKPLNGRTVEANFLPKGVKDEETEAEKD